MSIRLHKTLYSNIHNVSWMCRHGAGEYVNTIGGEVLRSADAICTTPDGHIVVSDILARRVFVFDIEGRVKARIHKNGDTILFYRPHQVG